MPNIILPSGQQIANQPYSRHLLAKFVAELYETGRSFTGFVSIATGSKFHILLFFKGRPYAAGFFNGDRHISLSIRDFFAKIIRINETSATLSIQATDPVLLKCLLTAIQDEPTVKAPTTLINLEVLLNQIHEEATDTLIVLKKKRIFNFFYFKDGLRGMSYFADTSFKDGKGLTTDEQMLLYAFQLEAKIDALIYRDITTQEAADSLLVSKDEILQVLQDETRSDKESEQLVEADEDVIENLFLQVIEGPQKGLLLSGSLPCVIGRKNADITVADAMVSKRHAAFQVVNERLMLMDLHSTNGTKVNDRQIERHEIQLGDVICIGETLLKVERIIIP